MKGLLGRLKKDNDNNDNDNDNDGDVLNATKVNHVATYQADLLLESIDAEQHYLSTDTKGVVPTTTTTTTTLLNPSYNNNNNNNSTSSVEVVFEQAQQPIPSVSQTGFGIHGSVEFTDENYIYNNNNNSITTNKIPTTNGGNSSTHRKFLDRRPSSGIVAVEEDDEDDAKLLGLLNESNNNNINNNINNNNSNNYIIVGGGGGGGGGASGAYQPNMILMKIMEEDGIGEDIIPGPPTPTISTLSTNVTNTTAHQQRMNRFGIGGSGSNKNRSTHSTSTNISNSGGGGSSSIGVGGVSGALRNLFTGGGGIISTSKPTTGSGNNSMNNSRDSKGGSSIGPTGNTITNTMPTYQRKVTTDELQISTTDYDYGKWTGNGILANRADLDIPWDQYAAGCHLLQACAVGNIETIQRLLDDDLIPANINFRDYDRRTALHVAASEGHLNVVQFLIARNAHVNRSDRWGGSPLDDAHRHRHIAVIEYLRQQGGTTGSGNRSTNLIRAAAEGDIDEVRVIIGQFRRMTTSATGISVLKLLQDLVNKGDYDRRTALHLASAQGHTDITKELIAAGADVNIEDRWHRRPIDDAKDGGHIKTVDYLRSVGGQSGVISSQQGENNKDDTSIHKESKQDLLDSSAAKRLIDTNLQVEFDSLEMIDRIGAGAFGEIYKCRWRGTLVAAKIIKTAKIRKEWQNRKQISSHDTTKPKQQQKLTTSLTKHNNNEEKGKNVSESATTDQIATTTTTTTTTTLPTTSLEEAPSEHSIDKSIVVDKKPSNDDIEHDLAIADFRQEISVLRSLRHPNIVLLLAYSTTQDYECLISELMKCSLLDVFKSHIVQGTKMSARTQLVYAVQLAQGMNYLHTCKPPVIHRDLKPANLLIDHSGVLKISDFGLSKVRPDPGGKDSKLDIVFMTGETGSYRFMAPEVYRHENYNETVDIYSFSMILYYLFVGRPPWPNLPGDEAVRNASETGDRPALPRNMDERLVSLLKECWDDNPSARPPFSTILDTLAVYVRSVFHINTNNEVISSTLQYNDHDTKSATHGCCTLM